MRRFLLPIVYFVWSRDVIFGYGASAVPEPDTGRSAFQPK